MKKVRFYGLLVACVVAAGCSESSSVDSENFGKTCSSTDECGDSLICTDGVCQQELGKGDKCGFMYTYCADGLSCLNGKCSEAGSGVNAKCSEDNPCAFGKVCISGQCVSIAGVGSECSKDEECAQGKCVEGVCKVTVAAGQSCGDGRECAEGATCSGGVCKTAVEVGGDCRSSLTFCDGGRCVRGVCVEGDANATCEDTDGDTIPDEYDRCDEDTDNDGIVNCMDLDSDNDTIPDTIEYGALTACDPPEDSDRDGKYDFLDDDSDDNGIPDSVEGRIVDENGNVVYPDTDDDGKYDFADEDNDGDMIDDLLEITGLPHPNYTSFGDKGPRGADCNGDTIPDDPGTVDKPFDCDGDTIPDYMDTDSDGDGISDFYEGNDDSDGDGYFDRYSQDSDGDGLPDSVEMGSGEVPAVSGTEQKSDYQNPDIDGDGLLDGYEVTCRVAQTCEEGQMFCKDSCIDITSDKNNCGGCGIACTSDETCEEAKCTLQCADDKVACNRKCIDVTVVDNHNCGACGTVCAANEICTKDESGEEAVISCVAADEADIADCTDVEGKSYCWGQCLDVTSYATDANNCGACGVVCESGKCTEGKCDPVESSAFEGGFKEVDTRFVADADGDTIGDSTEYSASQYKCQNKANYKNAADYDKFCNEDSPYYMTEFICDAKKGATTDEGKGIEGAFDFYFELPYQGQEEQDVLNFKPQVSKLDVVFDLDTTNSMGPEVNNLKEKINATEANNGIIAQIRKRVEDSAFGVVRFDDFPTRPTKGTSYDYLSGNGIEDGGYGRADECGKTQTDLNKPFKCDVPFKLEGRPEKDPATVEQNVKKLSLHHGGDFPEAGYESLWQIAMGDDTNYAQVSWYKYADYTVFASGKLDYTAKTPDRWGGAQFRNSTLPVVVHITDTTAHDNQSNCPCDGKEAQTCTCKPYDPAYVEYSHYSQEVHKAYQDKGARIITVYDAGKGNGENTLKQLYDTSKATEAVVPVCAFKVDANTWKCGQDLCCTTKNGVPAEGANKQCILSYTIESGDELSTTLVDGVDALVKYAVSDVAAIVKGEPISGYDGVDTSCFINGVVAFDTTTISKTNKENNETVSKSYNGYVAPPQEPEASCNPKAIPSKFNNSEVTNGYSNFAIGTSSSDKKGAQLNFLVKAQNNCVKPTTQMQIFEATIELINPKTGMSYGERKVSIVVPGVNAAQVN